jgi:glycyl-tRNA synthetase beta chain
LRGWVTALRRHALAIMRVSNIIKSQELIFSVDRGKFKDPCETVLWDAYLSLKDEIIRLKQERKYFEALNLMSGLRKPVDDFFDGVEVLTKDPDLRNNRVAILRNLSGLFLGLADFSKFSI